VKVDWTKYTDHVDEKLLEMAVQMSAHATDRAVTRDGKPVGITKDTIQHIINSAEDKILELGQKYSTLVIKTGNALNIVGAVAQEAGRWVFHVITIMIKKNFVPKNAWDKVVYVNELKAENIQATLISIIDRIENHRIKKMKQLQEMTVGRPVRYGQKLGVVMEVSPKQTSVIVEFTDSTKKRFFMNKRKNNETLDSLSLHEVMKGM
jgi:hypothetical protein